MNHGSGMTISVVLVMDYCFSLVLVKGCNCNYFSQY